MYVSPGLFYFQQFIFKKFKFRSESSRKVQFKDFWRKLIPPYLTLPQIKYWHLEYYVYFGKHISTNLQFKSPPLPPLGNRSQAFSSNFLATVFVWFRCGTAKQNWTNINKAVQHYIIMIMILTFVSRYPSTDLSSGMRKSFDLGLKFQIRKTVIPKE